MRRYKLSREAKNKADKNRAKVHEAFWKSIHAARAEKAAEEREKKRREMKVRGMTEGKKGETLMMECYFGNIDLASAHDNHMITLEKPWQIQMSSQCRMLKYVAAEY